MTFTSTLRGQKSKFTGPAQPNQSGTAVLTPQGNFLITTPKTSTNESATFDLAKNAAEKIIMEVNPKSVRFTQPKRYSRKDTLGGTVWYHFTNTKGQNNDVLTIDFRGNTGNIDRRGSLDPEAANGDAIDGTGALKKLIVWHNLYLLTREPMYLGNGVRNDFTISYISPLMPFAIDLVGFFTKVLDFEESADKPFSREYSMQFIVQRTSPDLDLILDHVSTVINASRIIPAGGANFVGALQGTDRAAGVKLPILGNQ